MAVTKKNIKFYRGSDVGQEFEISYSPELDLNGSEYVAWFKTEGEKVGDLVVQVLNDEKTEVALFLPGDTSKNYTFEGMETSFDYDLFLNLANGNRIAICCGKLILTKHITF